MTNDNKHEDNDRKKVSDEELEDVAGGLGQSFARQRPSVVINIAGQDT
ncbi:MAG: hypothetical protein VX764_07400 [Planctomycetota bacterium]|nr:hypothetical protein [Planctomycetota bacterium]